MIDFTVMILTLGFVYVTRLMIINSEMTKNIYSLHFLQDEEVAKIDKKEEEDRLEEERRKLEEEKKKLEEEEKEQD